MFNDLKTMLFNEEQSYISHFNKNKMSSLYSKMVYLFKNIFSVILYIEISVSKPGFIENITILFAEVLSSVLQNWLSEYI